MIGTFHRKETWPNLRLRRIPQAATQQKSRGHQDRGLRDHRGGVGVAVILARSYVGLNPSATRCGGKRIAERLGDRRETTREAEWHNGEFFTL